MSKSDESGKGVIFLNDEPDIARKKIMSAETDSFNDVQYDYSTRPGITNLLDILVLLGGSREEYISQKQYGPLKSVVAEKIVTFLRDFQALLAGVVENEIVGKLEASEAAMRKVAEEKLYSVQKAVGLR
jgi:tryptophanyl-tRNA synthetase